MFARGNRPYSMETKAAVDRRDDDNFLKGIRDILLYLVLSRGEHFIRLLQTPQYWQASSSSFQ